MKFGHFSHVWNKPGMSPAQRYEQLWRELALADEVGFDYGFAVEHHFHPNESWMPSPPVYCTGAAAHTKRLRIGPMGYVAPLYDPLRIAEEIGVLDQVLNGRFEAGIVSGITPAYFTHFKADFQNRRALTLETVSLLKAAFASEGPTFSFEGQYHQYEDVMLTVRPVQKPHPPIWVESRDPPTLEFLAQEGINTGYLIYFPRDEAAPRYQEYLRLWDAAGHAEKPNISYWTLVYVDETDEKALAKATPFVQDVFGRRFGYGDVGGITPQELVQNFERRGEHGAAEIARNMLDVDYLLKRNLVFIGSPRTVAKQMREGAEAGLTNTMLCEFNIGAIGEEDLMRSIRLFAEEVIPELRDYEPY
jgi:alkanesulfonate monooxygenase SsuD/methylene tetrahydromethanopterin reductase-like flavin-dependent oxidoreductase (luciferase family)